MIEYFVVFCIVGFFAGFYHRTKIEKHKIEIFELTNKLKKNMDIDLELATSGQLIKELEGRDLQYIIILPTITENTFGFSITVHGMEPGAAAVFLKLASDSTIAEMRKKGVEIPEIPEDFSGSNDDFE